MGKRAANEKWSPSASTAEDRPQKSKWPPVAVSILPGGTRRNWEVDNSANFKKAMNREEMEAKLNSTRLGVIILSTLTGGDESYTI